MANFMVPTNAKLAKGDDISSFDLPVDREVTLLQWGGDFSGNKLKPIIFGNANGLSIKVLPDKIPAASTLFKVSAKQTPATITIGAFVATTGADFSEHLTINVKPSPTKHPGYDFDLLAEMAASNDAKKIKLYSELMKNPKPLVEQNTAPGHYNCGDFTGGYGTKFFGKPTSTDNFAYYRKPTSTAMEDLRFDTAQMKRGIARIQSLLRQGISVRVWPIHAGGFGATIRASDATHYATIVGYGPNKFLFIDPWPDGSNFPYDGGMYPPLRKHPTF